MQFLLGRVQFFVFTLLLLGGQAHAQATFSLYEYKQIAFSTQYGHRCNSLGSLSINPVETLSYALHQKLIDRETFYWSLHNNYTPILSRMDRIVAVCSLSSEPTSIDF